MFEIKYQNLRIAPSYSAMRELMEQGKTLEDIKHILENGIDAPRKRKEGTIEKWLNIGNKTYNAVVIKDYNEILREEVWLLIHFGKFTRRN